MFSCYLSDFFSNSVKNLVLFSIVSVIKHSDQMPIRGRKNLFGLYFQVKILHWEDLEAEPGGRSHGGALMNDSFSDSFSYIAQAPPA